MTYQLNKRATVFLILFLIPEILGLLPILSLIVYSRHGLIILIIPVLKWIIVLRFTIVILRFKQWSKLALIPMAFLCSFILCWGAVRMFNHNFGTHDNSVDFWLMTNFFMYR